MPRIQVYLPDDLHRAPKKRRLSASELLQRALRAELRRLELLAETDRYVRGLVDRVGQPTRRDREEAEGLVARVRRQARRHSG
jgi:post-segregation antitoxin (ccd killing protein)